MLPYWLFQTCITMALHQEVKSEREEVRKRQYFKLYYQKHREEMIQYSNRYYWQHHDQMVRQKHEYKRKAKEKIMRILGNQCAVCKTSENLVFHHLDYSEANRAFFPTFKELKKGNLVLVCRRHHRAIHYINALRSQGYLLKVLDLLNNKSRNIYS